MKNWHRIRNDSSGLPAGFIKDKYEFGGALANLGDLDGDGVIDLAVGAIGDNSDNKKLKQAGAVYILFMQTGGTVKATTRIGDGTVGGLPPSTLHKKEFFGSDLANLGDIDGDGVTDLAVGALGHSPLDPDGKPLKRAGGVYVLLLNTDGTLKSHSLITDNVPENGFIEKGDVFGLSLSRVIDQNGDGINDLAVGAPRADRIDRIFNNPGIDTTTSPITTKDGGEVYLIYLNSDGSMQGNPIILDPASDGIEPPLDKKAGYGSSIGALSDVCFTILAVGASGDSYPDPVTNKRLSGAGTVYLSIPKTLSGSGKTANRGITALEMPESGQLEEAALTEMLERDKVIAYPNPTTGRLHLRLSNAIEGEVQIAFFDIMGREIHRYQGELARGQEYTVDLSDQKSGQYLVRVIYRDETLTGTVILNR